MKIKVLGTCASEGIPALFCNCELCRNAQEKGGREIRRRCGTLIDQRILIDLSPDLYMHKLNYGLRLYDLEHILISHSHSDHFDVWELEKALMPVLARRNIPILHVYGNASVESMYRACGLDRFPEQMQFHRLAPFTTFCISGYQVTPLKADHDPQQECVLFLVEKDGKSFLYGHDSGYYPEETWQFLQGRRLDLVEMDCVLGLHDMQQTHMGFPTCKRVRQRMQEEGMLHSGSVVALTHFTHNAGNSHQELVETIEPQGFTVCYDGIEFVL